MPIYIADSRMFLMLVGIGMARVKDVLVRLALQSPTVRDIHIATPRSPHAIEICIMLFIYHKYRYVLLLIQLTVKRDWNLGKHSNHRKQVAPIRA